MKQEIARYGKMRQDIARRSKILMRQDEARYCKMRQDIARSKIRQEITR